MEAENVIGELPNLSGVAAQEDVETKGGGKFAAQYINWAHTMQQIREAAPGWMPAAEMASDGGIAHKAPDGSVYLLVYWQHVSGFRTTSVAHAVMDHRMVAVPGDKVDSRDLSDGFVRGACKAAAVCFGYAWQLWSKTDSLGRTDEAPAESKPADAKPAKKKTSRKRKIVQPEIEQKWPEYKVETTIVSVKQYEFEIDGKAGKRYEVSSAADDKYITFERDLAVEAKKSMDRGKRVTLVVEARNNSQRLVKIIDGVEQVEVREGPCPF